MGGKKRKANRANVFLVSSKKGLNIGFKMPKNEFGLGIREKKKALVSKMDWLEAGNREKKKKTS